MEYLARPYEWLWSWARKRPTTIGRVFGFSLFTLAILITIPIVLIIGAVMAVGTMCSAIMG